MNQTYKNNDLPFKTTTEQIQNIEHYTSEMVVAGNDRVFVELVYFLAHNDQGVFDLLELWYHEKDIDEKAKIIVDLQDSVADWLDPEGSHYES